MTPICLHDRARLASFFRRSPALHAYVLGAPPIVQAITDNADKMRALLSSLAPLLPARMFLHLDQGGPPHENQSHGYTY